MQRPLVFSLKGLFIGIVCVSVLLPLTAQEHVLTAKADNPCEEIRVKAFSVGETAIIQFSPGNLQYCASSNSFRFAEHQYDFVGDDTKGNVYVGAAKCNNALISSSYTGWIDLFGFGTSGYNGKYPYMTSANATDYGNGNTDIAATDYDWGVYNSIGEDPAGTWRTLTKDEWVYLCNTRPNASLLKGQATVNGVTGLMLLPDGWIIPEGLTFRSGTNIGYSVNTYDSDQWPLMEDAGAIFLPAAGFRKEYVINNVGVYSYYRSSTHVDSEKAYTLNFYASDIKPQNEDKRFFGFSVRLVRNLEQPQFTIQVESENPGQGDVNIE